jgi:hypothetical protein
MHYRSDLIFTLFVLLSESRKSKSIRNLRRNLQTRQIKLATRIDFYIRLCQACQLLTPGANYQPTILCERFFSWERQKQYNLLLDGWVNMVRSIITKSQRDTIRAYILNDQPDQLSELAGLPSFGRELDTLRILGLLDDQELPIIKLGPTLKENNNGSNLQPWQYKSAEVSILVPYPTNLTLLWKLEAYLQPKQVDDQSFAFSYSIDNCCNLHTQQEKEQLAQIIQEGLQTDLPSKLLIALNKHPNIQPECGYLLTFGNRDTLDEISKDNKSRKLLEGLISPNHIFVPIHQAELGFKALEAKQWLPFPPELNRSESIDAEQAFEDLNLLSDLLTLAWHTHKHGLAFSLSKSNLHKLYECLPARIANLAIQKAEQIKDVKAIGWEPAEFGYHPGVQGSCIETIRSAIKYGASITIKYQGAGKTGETTRKISPLMLEKQGEFYYLVAFCETRCARRTFRLDRMQVLHVE